VAPIDDIRSTASYRKLIAGNLLEELLREFAAWGDRK
jgi:CO/xanthine dehydrogenase FAD-binding subunit